LTLCLLLAESIGEAAGLISVAESAGARVIEAVVPDALHDQGMSGLPGVSRLHLVEGFLDASPEALAEFISSLVENLQASLVLAPSRKIMRDVLARVAQRLSAPCATDCSKVESVGDEIYVERPCLGGGYVERLRLKGRPALLAVQLRAPSLEASNFGGRRVELVRHGKPAASGRSTRRVGLEKPSEGGVDLSRASIVVSVGRGFRRREDIAMAEELAHILNGELACSRPVASDLGWLPEERHVGLSGKWISPRLYIAIGISGQVQHMVGVRNSRIIVAINNDPNAPIHREADYSVVGDLYLFVPALIRVLRERKVRGV